MGEFWHPAGITSISGGRLLLADRDNWRLVECTRFGRITGIVGGRQSDGDTIAGRFREVTDVYAASWGDVYVADRGDDRIQAFHADGHIEMFRCLDVYKLGVDRTNETLVTISHTGMLRRFSRAGAQVSAWMPTLQNGQRLRCPTGLAIGSSGAVWIADSAARVVAEFSPDGVPTATFVGDGPSAWKPTALSLDDHDQLVVADRLGAELLLVAGDGDILGRARLPRLGPFASCIDAIHLQSRSETLVGDFNNNCVACLTWVRP